MAEAFAVVAVTVSILQLVDYGVRVSIRLRDFLKNVKEIPEIFQEVQLHLPLLVEILRHIQSQVDHGHYNKQIQVALQALVEGCNAQMTLLEDILTKVSLQGHDSNLTRGRKAICILRHEKLLANINKKLSGYIEKFVLLQCTFGPDHIIIAMEGMLGHKNKLQQPEETKNEASKLCTSQNGLKINNTPVKSSGKFAQCCMNSPDQRRRCIRIFISLARLNIMWGLKASLELTWGHRRYSLAPALELERIVNYTSPGFEILWKCEIGYLDLHSGLVQLERLFRAGRASALDVDPQGSTWLEKLLRSPLDANWDVRIAFLEKLMEWGAPLNTTKSLIDLCSQWTGMGPHIALLKALVAMNSSVLDDSRHDTKEWPLSIPISRVYPRANDIPDPFLLKFFVECSRQAFGFCEQTPLMDAILCGSTDEVLKSLQTQSPTGRNLRGQSAIHLAAALRTAALPILLESDVEVDARDIQGRAPLDYAAAYGAAQSVSLLLEAGARPVKEDEYGSKHITFFTYAANWEHWEVIAHAFPVLQASPCYTAEFLSNELNYLLVTFGHEGFMERSRGWKFLLELGANPNMTLEKRGTLLHLAKSPAEVRVLFEAGFKKINCPDSDGASPLMSLIRSNESDMYQPLLDRGADVNHEDKYGHSVLHQICYRIRSGERYDNSRALQSTSDAIFKTATLLRYGADPLKRDNCLCACSRHGCSASTWLSGPGDASSQGDIWCLEWLLMVRKCRGTATAQEALLDLVRVKEFDRLGMTHVCCSRRTSSGRFQFPMAEEEAYEIMEEERFLAQLLEDFMRGFSECLTDSVEEAWIVLLSRYFVLEEARPRRKWTWGIWQGTRSTEAFDWDEPPPWHRSLSTNEHGALNVSKPLEPVPCRYYIDQTTDSFRTVYWSEVSSTVSYSQLYSTWIQRLYEKKISHNADWALDGEWYKDRMRWAAYQTEMIEVARQKEIKIGERCVKEMEIG